MAEIKTKKIALNPVTFINSVKDERRRADAKQLLKIFTEATGEMGVGAPSQGRSSSAARRGRAQLQQQLMRDCKPVLWSNGMIGFGTYHYKSEHSSQEGDWPLTAFSPRAANLTVYIMSGAKSYGPLLKKLGKHKVSGGSCIYINKMADIHIPTLKALIKQSVRDMRKRYKTAS